MAKAKMAGTAKLLVPARIVLVSPPAGVAFAIQRGKRKLAPVYVSTGADLPLDFGIRVERASGGKLRFKQANSSRGPLAGSSSTSTPAPRS